MTFRQWVEQLIAQRFGTATAVANAMGLKLTPFQRGVEGGTFNIVNLLKLAKVADANPSTVLRLGRKSDEADLIEELYGPPIELTTSQRELLALWERTLEDDRAALLRVFQRFAGDTDVHSVEGRERSLSRRDTPHRKGPAARRRARPTTGASDS